jgi:hypothetical protein
MWEGRGWGLGSNAGQASAPRVAGQPGGGLQHACEVSPLCGCLAVFVGAPAGTGVLLCGYLFCITRGLRSSCLKLRCQGSIPPRSVIMGGARCPGPSKIFGPWTESAVPVTTCACGLAAVVLQADLPLKWNVLVPAWLQGEKRAV